MRRRRRRRRDEEEKGGGRRKEEEQQQEGGGRCYPAGDRSELSSGRPLRQEDGKREGRTGEESGRGGSFCKRSLPLRTVTFHTDARPLLRTELHKKAPHPPPSLWARPCAMVCYDIPCYEDEEREGGRREGGREEEEEEEDEEEEEGDNLLLLLLILLLPVPSPMLSAAPAAAAGSFAHARASGAPARSREARGPHLTASLRPRPRQRPGRPAWRRWCSSSVAPTPTQPSSWSCRRPCW